MQLNDAGILQKVLLGDAEAINSFRHFVTNQTTVDTLSFLIEKIDEELIFNDKNSHALAAKATIYRLRKDHLQDHTLAIELYERAIDLGNANAMCARAYMHEQGQGELADYSAAINLYEQAIILGNSIAMCNRGLMHKRGQGGVVNNAAAIELYEQAIALNNTQAMINRAYMHMRGQGGVVDNDAASNLFFQAYQLDSRDDAYKNLENLAKSNHVKSQFYLILILIDKKIYYLADDWLSKGKKQTWLLIYEAMVAFFDKKDSPIKEVIINDCYCLMQDYAFRYVLEFQYVTLKKYLYENSDLAVKYYQDNFFLKKLLNANDYFNLGNLQLASLPSATIDKESYILGLSLACKYFFNAYKLGDNDSKNILANLLAEKNSLEKNLPSNYQLIEEEKVNTIIEYASYIYRKEVKKNIKDHVKSIETFIAIRENKKCNNALSFWSDKKIKIRDGEIKLANNIINALKQQKNLHSIMHDKYREISSYPKLHEIVVWRLNEKDTKVVQLSNHELHTMVHRDSR